MRSIFCAIAQAVVSTGVCVHQASAMPISLIDAEATVTAIAPKSDPVVPESAPASTSASRIRSFFLQVASRSERAEPAAATEVRARTVGNATIAPVRVSVDHFANAAELVRDALEQSNSELFVLTTEVHNPRSHLIGRLSPWELKVEP